MPRYRSSIEVPLPVERAFAFVTDFRNAARWDPRVVRAEKLTAGPIRTGTRFRLVSRLLGKEAALPYEITAFENLREAVLEGRTVLFRYRDRIGFEPLSATGRTRLTYEAQLSLRGLLAIGNPVLALLFGRIGDDALDGIRRALLAAGPAQDPDRAPDSDAGGSGAPTPEEVRRIVAMDDRPVLRNLLITHGYHRLSQALAGTLGADHANWCTYATWASKTAGRFIREEELHEAFRRLLESKGRIRRRLHELHSTLDRGPSRRLDRDGPDGDLGPILEAVGEVGRFIREGNRTVFEELGGLFAELLVELEGHPEPDPERFERFLERLRPGGPEPDHIEPASAGPADPPGRPGPLETRPRGGQDLLRQSMRTYYAARFEPDPKRKAELILLGNALGGLHEQTRLQGYVVGALNAPVAEILCSHLRDALARDPTLDTPTGEALDRLLTPLGEEVGEAARELTTRLLMEQPIPGEVLALGKDHPAPPGGAVYPPLLTRIEHAELAAVLERFRAEPTSTAGLPLLVRLRTLVVLLLARLGLHRAIVPGSAARDWGELGDRMRYILVYFRSRQAQGSLFDPPFDEAQTAALRAGRVPEGRL